MITIEQYQKALTNLSANQLRILHVLYEIEPVKDSTIIAEKLGYRNWGGANLQIGNIGKSICNTLNIEPDLSNYNSNITNGGYFIVVHRNYRNDANSYWEMEPNLRKAIELYPLQTSESNEYYIQYHNADKLKYLPDTSKTDIESVRFEPVIRNDFNFYSSKKSLENASGKNCFIIVGTGEKNKKYFLWSFLKILEVSKSEIFFTARARGFNFEHPISLNDIEGFSDFKSFCGNFGIGFQNISKNKFCSVLVSLADEFLKLNHLTLEESNNKNLSDALNRINEQMKLIEPEKRKLEIEKLIRSDRQIVTLLKEIADYKCQFPNCNAEIKTKAGKNYVEVAHISPVNEGGQSILGNLLVLCPNHHKEFDLGDLCIANQSQENISGTLNGKEFQIDLIKTGC